MASLAEPLRPHFGADAATVAQGSRDWHEARLGCVTASRIVDVVGRTRTGYGAARQTYMRQLLAERMTGMPSEAYTNAAMRWGIEMEPHAVVAYEDVTGLDTACVGFLLHPKLAHAGASPDRTVGSDGLLEVKCPTTATHIDTLLTGDIAERYTLQMQWQLACSGRDWCDFVSYDPRMPPAFAVFVRRVERDADLIARLEREVAEFLGEIEDRIASLEARSGLSAHRIPAPMPAAELLATRK